MEIKIYINDRPVDEYSEKELDEIKRKLTHKAMKAAGYIPARKEQEHEEELF